MFSVPHKSRDGAAGLGWAFFSSQHRWLITKPVSPPAESQPVCNMLHLHHIRCSWNASDLNAIRKGASLLCAPRAGNSAGFPWAEASGTEEGSSCPTPAAKIPLKGDCHRAACCCPWGKQSFLCWGTGYESHPSLIASLLCPQLIIMCESRGHRSMGRAC